MSSKNEVFEYLIDQLRQQVNNNQCEDLAREVQSLKNQLRDASALVAELQEDNIKKSEHISHLTGQVKELHMALAQATGDVEAYKLIREQEQSGCRKEDTQECRHEFVYSRRKYLDGVFEPAKDCVHEWVRNDRRNANVCKKCGLKSPDHQKEDAQECEHDWYFYNKGASMMCKKCGLKK